MSAVELATAYISIAASGDDLAPSFGRSFRSVEKVAGASGKRMGQALTGEIAKATEQDVEKAKGAYEQASKQVTSTVERQATKVEGAKRKEEIAQAKVTEALAKYPKESSQVLAAQDRLALASQKVEAAQLEQESATERANKKLREAESALKGAEQAADDAATPFMSLGDRIQAAFKGDFKGAFAPLEREADGAAGEVEQEMKAAGDESGAGFQTALTAGLAGLAGIAASAGVTFGGGFLAAVEQQVTTGKMQAALGLDRESASAMAESAIGLYAAGYGESSESAVSASISAQQIIPQGSTSEISALALVLEEAFGYDTQESITAVSQMMRTGMADSATEAFDAITAGAQMGADQRGDLLDTMTEYGNQFEKLGIDGPMAMGLISQGLAGGARDADQVADSLKELSIRAVDDSETTRAAYDALGLNADDMAARFGAGGETAAGALDLVLERLGGMEDPVARQAAAVGLFGTQAENLGGALFALDPSTATAALDGFAGSTEKAGEALAESRSPLETLQRGFAGVTSEVAERFQPAIELMNDAIEAAFGYIQDSVIPALETFGEWVVKNEAWLVPLATALGVVAGAVTLIVGAMALWAGVTSLMAAAQTALNLSLLANPITWIIIGIVALAAAFVVAYQRSETFRNIVNGVWESIKNTAGAVADWFMEYVWPVIQAAWDGIAAGAQWLWQNVLVPAWDGIKTAISAVVDWLVNTAWPFIKGVWDAIAGAAVWLYENIMLPVWDGIRIAIAIAATAIMTYIDLLKWYFDSVIAPVAIWLYENVMLPVWNGIKSAIGAVVEWFRDTAWPALKSVIDWIGNAFNVLRDALNAAWTFIKDQVIAPVVAWFRDVVWPLIDTVLGWIQMSFEGWKIILGAVWDFVKNQIIAPVVAWFRDVAWSGIISPTIEAIKTGFNLMRDSLRNAWNFIKDNVISPVASWFRDTVGPLFDRVTDGIKSAFEMMKDSVQKAWEGIRDTAKVPVEFVVNKIINDAIIGNFNSVAEKLFGNQEHNLATVSLPGGWRKGGILPGYQPMAGGDDVLTPMRSGEGVLVSEGLRDAQSRQSFLAANEAAKRGVSFSDFLGAGYAGGGLVNLRMPFAGSYPRGDGYGARGGAHKGIDWPMPSGAALKAVAAGTVSHTWNSAAGRKLELSIGNGLVAGYHHLSSYIAGHGASVGRGADVARVGSTGRSSGPHLHFSLKRDGSYVDPAPYLGAGGEAGSDGGWWNPFTSLWSSIKDKVSAGVGDGAFGDFLFELPQTLIGGAKDWVGDKITALGDWASESIDTAGGYARWTPVATHALTREGQLGPRRFDALMRRMNQESSFNPRAINTWDSNAAAGQASRGLMQVIPSTFAAYRDKSLSSDIYDPLANIVASIRYTLDRYGDLETGWNRPGGYAMGGIVDGEIFDTGGVLDSGQFAMNLSGRPEVVLNPDESRAYMAGQASAGQAPTSGDTFVGYGYTPEEIARAWRVEQKKREALHAR